MRERTCCFTGHRKIPQGEMKALAANLEKTLRGLIEEGICFFGAGGALGFDTLAAQTVLRLRREYTHIRLIMVLPCPDQTRWWSAPDVEEYGRIMSLADKVVYVSQHYDRGCMHRRNRHLVENSGVCVSYLTQPAGGTAYTVGLARERGLRVIDLAEMINKTGV